MVYITYFVHVSMYGIFKISDKLESVLSASHDEIFSKSIGMQYALYTTTFIAAIGGGFFLFSTLTVEKDKAVSQEYILYLQYIKK